MKVNYYPGCSLKGTAKDYAASVEAVSALLDVELEELQDWNCCGATAAHSLSRRIAVDLAGRNLALAEASPCPDLVAPCPLCFNRLKTAERELTGARRADYRVAIAGDRVRVWDLANFMARGELLDKLADRIQRDLAGLRAVCYYGCMASRPPTVTGERQYENPMSLDRIMERLGVQAIQWPYKTDCCGAGHLVARPDIVFTLVGKLYESARRAGADCLVVSCQMCQANLDMHQNKILKEMGADYRLPVMYFTELIGLALSHERAPRWLKQHFVDPSSLIAEKCGAL